MQKRFSLFVSLLAVLLTITPLKVSANGVTEKFRDDDTYYIEFAGDDHFDEFLSEGASSDSDAIRFALKYCSSETNEVMNGQQITMPEFGCSSVVAKAKNGYLYGRNFDYADCNMVILKSNPKYGYKSISTVNPDFLGANNIEMRVIDATPTYDLGLLCQYAPLDGMNEKGLYVSVLMLPSEYSIRQQTKNPDITVTTLVRLLLNKADSVASAKSLLKKYDLNASVNVHFAIADKDGKSVVAEYIDNELTFSNTKAVTNTYIAKNNYKVQSASPTSKARMSTLNKFLKDHKKAKASDVKHALSDVKQPHTQWSVIYNTKTKSATYYRRGKFNKSYTYKVN